MQGEEEQARVWRAADEKSVGGAYRHTATLLWPGYTPRLQKSRPEAEPHPPPAGPLLVGRPDSKLSLKKKKKKTGGAGEERPGTTAASVSVPGAAHPAPKLPSRPAQPASLRRANRSPRELPWRLAAGQRTAHPGSLWLAPWSHVLRARTSYVMEVGGCAAGVTWLGEKKVVPHSVCLSPHCRERRRVQRKKRPHL